MGLSDYLGYFPGKDRIRVDFHNHGQTGSYFKSKQKRFGRFWGFVLSEGFSDLTRVIEKTMDSELDVLYITNFADRRFEDWTSQDEVEKAREAGYEINIGRYYVFAKRQKDGKVIALGKSQEIPTKIGHLLVSGLERGRKISSGRSLDDTIKEVDNELIIADHPYAHNGIFRETEEGIEKVDALERNANSYFPFLANWRAKKASRKYNKPLITNSDGHHPKDIGKTYNIFNSADLNYDSEREFRDSIKQAVLDKKFRGHFSPIPPWRIFHHVFMLFLYILKDKFKKK